MAPTAAMNQYFSLKLRTRINIQAYGTSYGPCNLVLWLRKYLDYHTKRYLLLSGYQQLGSKWMKVFEGGEIHIVNLDENQETIYKRNETFVFPDTAALPLTSRP